MLLHFVLLLAALGPLASGTFLQQNAGADTPPVGLFGHEEYVHEALTTDLSCASAPSSLPTQFTPPTATSSTLGIAPTAVNGAETISSKGQWHARTFSA